MEINTLSPTQIKSPILPPTPPHPTINCFWKLCQWDSTNPLRFRFYTRFKRMHLFFISRAWRLFMICNYFLLILFCFVMDYYSPYLYSFFSSHSLFIIIAYPKMKKRKEKRKQDCSVLNGCILILMYRNNGVVLCQYGLCGFEELHSQVCRVLSSAWGQA